MGQNAVVLIVATMLRFPGHSVVTSTSLEITQSFYERYPFKVGR